MNYTLNYTFTSEHPILLAISDRWIEMLSPFFQDAGLEVLAAPSYAESCAPLAAAPISGIVLGFEWAVDDESGRKGIVGMVQNRIPTITLVQRGMATTTNLLRSTTVHSKSMWLFQLTFLKNCLPEWLQPE
jgi:hypothetical protein